MGLFRLQTKTFVYVLAAILKIVNPNARRAKNAIIINVMIVNTMMTTNNHTNRLLMHWLLVDLLWRHIINIHVDIK